MLKYIKRSLTSRKLDIVLRDELSTLPTALDEKLSINFSFNLLTYRDIKKIIEFCENHFDNHHFLELNFFWNRLTEKDLSLLQNSTAINIYCEYDKSLHEEIIIGCNFTESFHFLFNSHGIHLDQADIVEYFLLDLANVSCKKTPHFHIKPDSHYMSCVLPISPEDGWEVVNKINIILNNGAHFYCSPSIQKVYNEVDDSEHEQLYTTILIDLRFFCYMFIELNNFIKQNTEQYYHKLSYEQVDDKRASNLAITSIIRAYASVESIQTQITSWLQALEQGSFADSMFSEESVVEQAALDIVLTCFEHGYLNLIKSLLSSLAPEKQISYINEHQKKIIASALTSHDIGTLRWLKNILPEIDSDFHLSSIIYLFTHGSLETIRFFMEETTWCPDDSDYLYLEEENESYNTLLSAALKGNTLEVIEYLYAQKPEDLDCTDKDAHPLLNAVCNPCPNVLNWVIETNKQEQHNNNWEHYIQTAFITSLKAKCYHNTYKLLKHYPDYLSKRFSGQGFFDNSNLLMLVGYYGTRELFEDVLQKYSLAAYQTSGFGNAARYVCLSRTVSSFNKIKMLQALQDVNKDILYQVPSKLDFNILADVIKKQDFILFAYLLQVSATFATLINSDDGFTPLMMAAKHGAIRIAEQLLDFAPELLNQTNRNGATAVDIAAHYDQPAILLNLLNRGGMPNTKFKKTWNRLRSTTLKTIIGNCRTLQQDCKTVEQTKALMSGPLKLNLCLLDRHGNNLLHYAYQKHSVELIKFFNAADLAWTRNSQGETPIEFGIKSFKKTSNVDKLILLLNMGFNSEKHVRMEIENDSLDFSFDFEDWLIELSKKHQASHPFVCLNLYFAYRSNKLLDLCFQALEDIPEADKSYKEAQYWLSHFTIMGNPKSMDDEVCERALQYALNAGDTYYQQVKLCLGIISESNPVYYQEIQQTRNMAESMFVLATTVRDTNQENAVLKQEIEDLKAKLEALEDHPEKKKRRFLC